MAIYEMFPEGIIALNKELASGYHPTLAAHLSKHASDDTEIRLAEIASYCGVVLDDVYHPEDINHLSAVLAGRLEVLRQIIPAQVIQDLLS